MAVDRIPELNPSLLADVDPTNIGSCPSGHYVEVPSAQLPLSVGGRGKTVAPGEARTHGLQIMRLTRCLLRYGGLCNCTVTFLLMVGQAKQKCFVKKISCQKGDSNPRPHKRTRNLLSSPIRGQGCSLESGALDHSAILTCVPVSPRTVGKRT